MNATATTARRARIPELDVLRGLAILLVLGFHSPGPSHEAKLLRPLDLFLHRFGWTGVDLFFVLSGFLIGGLLFHEIERNGELDTRRFLMRRMLRIWPAYYCLVAVAIVRLVIDAHGDVAGAFGRMWPALVHIQNFREVPRTQLWSLAIEEHFYLALPFLLWLLARRSRAYPERAFRSIPGVCVGLVVGCLALRTLLVFTTTLNVRNQTYLCIDALFLGVTLAYIAAHQPGRLEKFSQQRWLLPAACLLFALAMIPGKLQMSFGLTAPYLGFALVLIRLVHPDSRGVWTNRFLASPLSRGVAWVGTYSYSIYLWHYDTGWIGYRWARRASAALGLPSDVGWLLHTTLWFVMSIATGVILAKLIEMPVMRVRERLFPAAALRTNVAAPGNH